MDRRAFIGLASLAASGLGAAATLPAGYQPNQQVTQAIRIWGSPDDQALVDLWSAGFHRFHPQARVLATLRGTESAMAGLYTDSADLAFIGREMRLPVERMAFEWVKLRRPTVIEVATAGLHARRVACTLGVFVHPAAPVKALSLPQLQAIFGGESASHLQVFTPKVDSIAALYFRKAVLHDSFKWNPELCEAGSDAALVDAVAADANAIAFGPIAAATDRVRLLALARQDDGVPVAPSVATVADRSYPLARAVHVVLDKPKDGPPAPHVTEFLRYVLSNEGQADVARDAAYVPLAPQQRARQLENLA